VVISRSAFNFFDVMKQEFAMQARMPKTSSEDAPEWSVARRSRIIFAILSLLDLSCGRKWPCLSLDAIGWVKLH